MHGLCKSALLSIFPQLFKDVNECEEMTNTCHPDRAYCLNRDGGFHCKCKVGYKLSDEEECVGNVADLMEDLLFSIRLLVIFILLRCE